MQAKVILSHEDTGTEVTFPISAILKFIWQYLFGGCKR